MWCIYEGGIDASVCGVSMKVVLRHLRLVFLGRWY